MSLFREMFSEEYNDFLLYRDRVKALVVNAQESIKGCKLFGREINTSNPEDVIAVLYLLYKDKEAFHESF